MPWPSWSAFSHFGILQGILLAALVSVLLILLQNSTSPVAFLGRIPGTRGFSDMELHRDSEPLPGALVFRPESSLLILNADYVLISVLERLAGAKDTSRGYCDLSASPMMDLAGAHMLAELAKKLSVTGISLTVFNPHGRVRELLRAEGLDARIHGVARGTVLEGDLAAIRTAGERNS